MHKVVYAMVCRDESNVHLGYVSDEARLIERLDRVCAFMHLDASIVATVPQVALRAMLGELNAVPQAAIEQLAEEGEVVCEASVL